MSLPGAAGFTHADLSVLDTHESISASVEPGEVKFVGPLTAAGLIVIASGPVGMAVAGVALAELLEKVRATPHTESFALALESGAVLLWVAAPDPGRQDQARAIMAAHGAADIHLHARGAAG